MNVERNTPKRAQSDLQLNEIEGELKMLRVLVRETAEQFILRREGEIESLLANIAELPPKAIRQCAPRLLNSVRKLNVKPNKGRLRDLKELIGLIEDLAEILDEMHVVVPVHRKRGKTRKETEPAAGAMAE